MKMENVRGVDGDGESCVSDERKNESNSAGTEGIERNSCFEPCRLVETESAICESIEIDYEELTDIRQFASPDESRFELDQIEPFFQSDPKINLISWRNGHFRQRGRDSDIDPRCRNSFSRRVSLCFKAV